MQTVADFLADQLAKTGVRTVYGLPGGENVEILEAIRRRGIQFLLVTNESSACYMAATSARLTGVPGVALTTLGPGATNAYAGFAHACLDRAPILLLTAVSDPILIGRHTHQVLDLESVFRPVSKMTANITADNAAEMIVTALKEVRNGRPGPVHLSIHNDIAVQQLEMLAPHRDQPIRSSFVRGESSRIRALLSDKRRPVLVAGLGLEPERPYVQLRQFAEALGAPVIDTPKSKGALSSDHPLFAGTLGLTVNDPAYQILDESDCIIALGFDVVELVKPWDQQQPLVWIANWANEDPRIQSETTYVGSITDLLTDLLDIGIEIDENWGRARVASFRASQAAAPLPSPQGDRILPQHLLNALRDHTPDDVIITTDVGSHKIFSALNWRARTPNRYFVSNGLSAMGFGLSSAIAAAQASGQQVVCITGDAGLAMSMGELGLLSPLDLPVIVIVMNDSALDLIRSAQVRRERAVFGTEFSNPDFRYIAKAYSLDYRRVENVPECADAIRHGMANGKPMLIDVMTDPVGYPTTVSQ